jgi:hypothetical protein
LLRKPNYGEALDTLQQLIGFLKREKSNHHYAAFCCLAVARCEQALKNTTMEAAALVDAGTENVYQYTKVISNQDTFFGKMK